MRQRLFLVSLVGLCSFIFLLLNCSSIEFFCRDNSDCEKFSSKKFCCLGRCVENIDRCKSLVSKESNTTKEQKSIESAKSEKIPPAEPSGADGGIPDGAPSDTAMPEGGVPEIPEWDTAMPEGGVPEIPEWDTAMPEGTGPSEGIGGERSPISYCKIPCCVAKGKNICEQKPMGRSLKVQGFSVEYSLMTYYGCESTGKCSSVSDKCIEGNLAFPGVWILGAVDGALFILDSRSISIPNKTKKKVIYKLKTNSNNIVGKSRFAYLPLDNNTSYEIISTHHTNRFLFILMRKSIPTKSDKLLLGVLDAKCRPSSTFNLPTLEISKVKSLFDSGKKMGIASARVGTSQYLFLFGIKSGKPVFYWSSLSNFIDFNSNNCNVLKKTSIAHTELTGKKVTFNFLKSSPFANQQQSNLTDIISADVSSSYAVMVGRDSGRDKIVELYEFSTKSQTLEFDLLYGLKGNGFGSLSSARILAVRSSKKLLLSSSSVRYIFYLLTTKNIYLLTFENSMGEVNLFPDTGSGYSDFNAYLKWCSNNVLIDVSNFSIALDPTTAGYERLFFVSKSPSGQKKTIRILLIRSVASSSP